MARDPATQPNLENYEPAQTTPAGGYPGGSTAYPPAPNPYLRSPLPPSQQTSVDQLRQFYRIGTPQNRTLPLQPNANPANNAASQTVAQQVAETIINNGVAADVTLTMPVQYTVSGSPGDDLGVQWVPVAPGLVLAGPGPISALESLAPAADTGALIALGISPVSPVSWALFVEYSNNNLIAAPAGWTVIHSTTSQNAYYINVTGTAPLDLSLSLSAPTSFVAALFGFAGPAPPIVQVSSGTIVGGSGSVTLSSPVTAGNVLWAVIQAYDGSAVFGTQVQDTLGNEFDLISVQAVGAGGSNPAQTQNIYAVPSINTTGADTVTMTYLGSGTPPSHKEFLIFETGPLTPGPGLPFFRQLAPSEIPALENLSGILPVAKGGTGLTNPALVAGSGITISGTWPNQTVADSGGGGGTPSGSTGDVQINNAGAFGTATDIQAGAGININSGSLQFSGGIGLAISGGPLSVLAGASGNIILRTNGNVQIDSNGSNLLLGTTFSSGITLGGSASNIAFYGGSRQPQATITGSRAGNVALASLLTNLAAFGLIVDGSTP